MQHTTRPPGPPFWTMSELALQRNPLSFAGHLWHRYGDTVRFRFLKWPATVCFHPDAVKQIVLSKNYSKDTMIIRAVKVIHGNGLFTNEGDSWLRQRRMMQPMFHRQRVASFGALMIREATDLVQKWETVARKEQHLDMQAEMEALTLRIVSGALFSSNLGEDVERFSHIYSKMLPAFASYILTPFPPLSVPIARNRQLVRDRAILDEIVYRLIRARRVGKRDPEDSNDLLSLLIEARDAETGEQMTDKQVRDEVMTLLIGGHQTTSEMLTLTFAALAQYPEVEQ